jgi:hypothetical protein
MTDILIRNLSVARKPRTLKPCIECPDPTYPGVARYRVQYFEEGHELEAHLHLQCAGKWIARLIRDHRERLKKEGAK